MAHKVRVGVAHTARASDRIFDLVLYAVFAIWVSSLAVSIAMVHFGVLPVDTLFGVFGLAVAGGSVVGLLAWASLLSHVRFRRA